MDEVVLEGKTYIGSKKAAIECGYTQDYVGQLARGGLIDAKRVSGQWYIFLDSLKAYKTKAETFKPEPPKYQPDPSVEATLDVDGKKYVSAARAAKLTEYNQDYIGQLARAGKIPSKQVGSRWYIEQDALLIHKKEKDAMLRAVQAESVGLKRSDPQAVKMRSPENFKNILPLELLVYKKENRPLFPEIIEEEQLKATPVALSELPAIASPMSRIPIRMAERKVVPLQDYTYMDAVEVDKKNRNEKTLIPGKSIFNRLFLPATLCLVIVLTAGLSVYKKDSIYAVITGTTPMQTASVGRATDGMGAMLEKILTKELIYKRF